MILILAPTVLIGLLLSIFFVVHRYNDLQRQLEDAGASIIEPLAVSSEYGMNLQNRESIGQLISVLHRRYALPAPPHRTAARRSHDPAHADRVGELFSRRICTI